jgi:hypothetical protein
MKIFSIITLLAVGLILSAVAAQADGYGGYGKPTTTVPVFSIYSTPGASGVQVVSATIPASVFSANMCRVKTVYVQGVAISGHTNAALSGSMAILTSPTGATGSFVPLTGTYTTAVGGAMALTTNGALSWTGAEQYIALGWTKTAGNVTAYFSCSNY